jgi:hypothetical protein
MNGPSKFRADYSQKRSFSARAVNIFNDECSANRAGKEEGGNGRSFIPILPAKEGGTTTDVRQFAWMEQEYFAQKRDPAPTV